MSADLRHKLIFSLILALLIYVALALWSDWRALKQALTEFPWAWLPAVIGLTLVNYVGRLLKWQWYLRVVKVDISSRDSARIFGVGMLMVMTPGKAGEFLKSYMVKNVTGAPMSTTAPIVLAERITDGLAMLILASVGLFAFPHQAARTVALVVFSIFVAGIAVIQYRPLALYFLGWGKRLPVVKKFAGSLYRLYESAYILFSPRILIVALLVGMVNWGAEGLAYFLVLHGFGVPFAWQNVLLGVFIFNISTVIGAVLALPGGLGGVEGSLVGLSSQIFGLTVPVATAAALLIRFCTLWMGVGIGVVSILLWHDLLAGAEKAERLATAAAGEQQAPALPPN